LETPKQEQERTTAIQTALNTSWQLIRDDESYVNPDDANIDADLFACDWDLKGGESWADRQERLWKETLKEVRSAFVSVATGSRRSVLNIFIDISDFANMARERTKGEEQVHDVGEQLNNDT